MEKVQAEIKVLQAKKEALFQNVSAILEFSKKLNERDRKSLIKFKVKIESLECLKVSFLDTLERLNILQAEADKDFVIDFKAQDSLLEMYGIIRSAYDELEFIVNSPVQPNPNQAGGSQAQVPQPVQPVKVKLPQLDLPVFTGETPAEWVIFQDLFKSLIHDRTDLSSAQKCQYLISKLSGKALACCALPPTPENYLIIWESLVDRYNDKRVLCSNYLDTILNFKPVKTETANALNSFVEKFSSAVSALKALNLNNLHDVMLVHIAMNKLCPDTVKLFERTLDKDEIPTFAKLVEFVKDQSRLLSRIQSSSSTSSPVVPSSSSRTPPVVKPRFSQNFLVTDAPPLENCFVCKKVSHALFRCEKFQSLSPRDRYDLVKGSGRCLNCLASNHGVKNCSSKHNCSKCSKRHHSLLHFPIIDISPSLKNSKKESSSTSVVSTCSLVGRNISNSSRNTVLLSTVQVLIEDSQGDKHLARFLLDSGSQSNFITKKLCNKLKITPTPGSTEVSGLGSTAKPVLGNAKITIESKLSASCTYQLDVLVIDTITERLPSTQVQVDSKSLIHLQNLSLADNSFGTPGEIQGLLGASLYPYLLLPGQVSGDSNGPIALNTTLGYVVVGEAPVFDSVPSSFCGFVQTNNLESMVKQFFDQEDIADSYDPMMSKDSDAELHFQKNSRFDSDQSRYLVKIPFKESPDNLGSSYAVTFSRFLALERRLEKNPRLRDGYNLAIQELVDAHHLEPCPAEQDVGYFVPHREVIKDHGTTKFRIVYDFSCPTDNGKSLNDIVHSGPKLYNDLFNILLNFRLFRVALVADITKMFLQILMDPEDCKYQKIFWRFGPHEPVQVYKLNRVTFGMTSSPFLSQRVIRQLAMDNEKDFPLVKPVVLESFYMDDLTTSVEDRDNAIELQAQLVACFKKGGFDLVKWASNDPELLSHLSENICVPSLFDWDNSKALKILGMSWNPVTDLFSFQVDLDTHLPCTKRVVLSNLAKIWDPLGLISPVTLYFKLIMQALWQLNLPWDTEAPISIAEAWSNTLLELKLLSGVRVPRHTHVDRSSELILVGMCDASERACAAVVYARTSSADGLVQVSLLASKSKLAGLQKKVSVPRLELNASHLLSRLIHIVYSNYHPRHPISQIICLSDSTVALHWINSPPHRWQTYVANRVTKIQSLVSPECWYHVAGKDNASADSLSRGLTPSQLLSHPTWFEGPSFLQDDLSLWPISRVAPVDGQLPEEKVVTLVTAQLERPFILKIADRFSSWRRLISTLVYLFRFIGKLPRREKVGVEVSDVEFAELQLWLAVQKHYLDIDAKNLQHLAPFISSDELIRVGGRLRNAELTYSQKHPILLPKKEHAVRLLIEHTHVSNLHTGPALVLAILRQKYWILAARPLVRQVTRSCNQCFRCEPRNDTPIMGDLPKYRIAEVKPFANTGVDFAGPFQITLSKHRGVRTQKAYLCLFICLTTKALYLDLAPDLSRDAFLNVLKRFLARRGPVSCIYSDNGTNFVGSKNFLDDMYRFFASDEFTNSFGQEMVKNRITWKTLPPAAPHMAGIWERGVRSVKIHLVKVVGTQILSFEEFLTVLAEIESLLNSRPLCPLNSDPNDLEPLTPAHFLKLTPLHHLPAVPVDEQRLNRLTRFQLLDSLVQSFWKRWSLEYLNSLQERAKWRTSQGKNMEIGTVVLLKDENTIPLQWKMGIVEEVHPGLDGVVRVATVRTSAGRFKRPVVKLCPLPSQ